MEEPWDDHRDKSAGGEAGKSSTNENATVVMAPVEQRPKAYVAEYNVQSSTGVLFCINAVCRQSRYGLVIGAVTDDFGTTGAWWLSKHFAAWHTR